MFITKKKLGSTGIEVSVLGLGTVKFGRDTGIKYPHSFSIPNEKEALNLLSLAKHNGINLLDTAPSYGNSEERLGKLLGKNRKEWVIISKVGEEYKNSQST